MLRDTPLEKRVKQGSIKSPVACNKIPSKQATESKMVDEDTVEFKFVIIGCAAVGKSAISSVFSANVFPSDYIPTVFDTTSTKLIVNDRNIKIILFDTAGQVDFDKLRPLSYNDTDMFLICYSVGSRQGGINDITTKWVPEIKSISPESPFYIIGTKIDLRDNNKDPLREGIFTTTREGDELAEELSAIDYLECSALLRQNIDEIFIEAVKYLLSKSKAIDENNHSEKLL